VDFFTPVVDDPYWFGQIAAANALSDVYAMGGKPKTAMNLVAFPARQMDLAILREIIRGGMDKLREAEVALVGGHSIYDKEIKYGLSVTGTIRPDRILVKRNLRSGDRFILTKPVGTGVVNTAIKAALATPGLVERVTRLMATLNRDAAEVMAAYDVGACTDVTGFGLLGHLAEMVCGAGLGVRLDAKRVPVIPEALEFAAMGLIPASAYQNRSFREGMIKLADTVSRELKDLLFDPQTSGGLLITVRRDQAAALVADLQKRGMEAAAIIGEVVAGSLEKIWVV
jgi:selenide,water dikinase